MLDTASQELVVRLTTIASLRIGEDCDAEIDIDHNSTEGRSGKCPQLGPIAGRRLVAVSLASKQCAV